MTPQFARKQPTKQPPQDIATTKRLLDPALSIEDKRLLWDDLRQKKMNPVPQKDFNPDTFDPNANHPLIEVMRRPRKEPPKRLPCLGMKPKEIVEGQMVGMFETKQDLYLHIAHLSNRITDLEEALDALKNGQNGPQKP